MNLIRRIDQRIKNWRHQRELNRIAKSKQLTHIEKAVAIEKKVAAKSVNDLLKDPEARERAITWSEVLAKKFRNNWFTILEVHNKFKHLPDFGTNEIHELLQFLVLFKSAVVKDSNGVIRYKICLSSEIRRDELQKLIDSYLGKVAALQNELKAIKD